ncbi:MAG TPA: di-trans,poly-cis-decaprenylcistransferase [Gemmatimonadaceae bacterium]|nr:di-trans,poly-cis-decaprenylcistransferase [Gemmatimonadaceae bacterium]
MDQSSFRQAGALHVGIIMDGNGRWAIGRGLPRTAGHAEGARAVRRTVEGAARLGVGTLTLYAFSADNWRRPSGEVGALMRLFRRYLAAETARCVDNGIRLTIVGRRDRLPRALVHAIEGAERATAGGTGMRLRIAIDYSSRDAILRAAERLRDDAATDESPTHERFAKLLGAVHHQMQPAADVDLLIRTGGERRLSDFLLWECAYAELYFTARLWPDFGEPELAAALDDFASRDRRFGAITSAVAG